MPIDFQFLRDTPYWLNFVFDGKVFSAFDRRTVPSNSSIYIEPRVVNSSLIHIVSREHIAFGSAPIVVDLIEGATFDQGITPIPTHNFDRRVGDNSDLELYSDPTNVSGGEVIDRFVLFGQGQGSNVVGDFGSAVFERLFDNTKKFLIKITNETGQNTDFFSRIIWYESVN